MTTSTFATTFDTSTNRWLRNRWSIALAVGTLATAGIVGGFAIADGSASDATVTPAVEQVVEVVDEGGAVPVGPVSADSAERRAGLRCSGLSADAAERCAASGR